MKKLIIIFLVNVFCLTFLYAGNSENSKDKWEIFSQNLVTSLKSDNPGVRQSAMLLIIEYSDKINVQDGVLDVMRTFRNSKDTNLRKLALITLYKMKSDWAIDFLKMHQKFEDNNDIKNTIASIVTVYNNKNNDKISHLAEKMYAEKTK